MANVDVGVSFSGETNYKGQKLIYPAANRNKEPILEIMKKILPPASEQRLLLEIASGSGQHLCHFAPHFPNIIFQPSEFDQGLLGSIEIYSTGCKSSNMKLPVNIDVTRALSDFGYKLDSIDYIYNANMMHISPYECTVGLFCNAGKYLKPSGLLITYGPYSEDGILTPQSNIDFNLSLKSRDESWGIRDITDLKKLAESNNISLTTTFNMPANNKCLIWKKL